MKERSVLTTKRTQLLTGLLVACALLIGTPPPSMASESGELLIVGEHIWSSKAGRLCPAKKIPEHEFIFAITEQISGQLSGPIAFFLDAFVGKNTERFEAVPGVAYQAILSRLDFSVIPVRVDVLARWSGRTRSDGTAHHEWTSDGVLSDFESRGSDNSVDSAGVRQSVGTQFLRVTLKWKKNKKAVGTGVRVALVPAS